MFGLAVLQFLFGAGGRMKQKVDDVHVREYTQDDIYNKAAYTRDLHLFGMDEVSRRIDAGYYTKDTVPDGVKFTPTGEVYIENRYKFYLDSLGEKYTTWQLRTRALAGEYQVHSQEEKEEAEELYRKIMWKKYYSSHYFTTVRYRDENGEPQVDGYYVDEDGIARDYFTDEINKRANEQEKRFNEDEELKKELEEFHQNWLKYIYKPTTTI